MRAMADPRSAARLRKAAVEAGVLDKMGALVSSAQQGAGALDDCLCVIARIVPAEGLPALWQLFADPNRVVYAAALVEAARKIVELEVLDTLRAMACQPPTDTEQRRALGVVLGMILLRGAGHN